MIAGLWSTIRGWFGRGGGGRDDVSDVLYVHLRRDGGIFIIPGRTCEESIVTLAQLERELSNVRAAGGSVLYSRSRPDADPPPIVDAVFRKIVEHKLPMRLTPDAHPNAERGLDEGATALMAAASFGQLDLLADLIARGAELEAQDDSGYTALMYACNHGQTEAAKRLVQGGAGVNAKDNDGSTPLMFAAQGGHTAIVRTLLEKGADRGARGTHGMCAADFAVQNGHVETAALLGSA